MKTLLTVLVLAVVALGATAEWAAPRLVADRVEQRVNDNLGGAASVEADAGTFPFVPRLVADNRVRRVTVTLDELAGQELTFGSVAVELHGIALDREQLFSGDVEVTAIDSGTAIVTVDDSALDALGQFLPGDVDPSQLATGQGLESLSLPLPDRLIPCAPQARDADEGLRLSCEFQQVPSVLLRAAQ